MAPTNQMNGGRGGFRSAVMQRGGHHRVLADQFIHFRPEKQKLPGFNESKCFMCNVSFGSVEEYETHTNSTEHKFREQYRMNRRDVKNNSNSGILVDFEVDEIFLEVNEQKKVNFQLTNRTDKEVTLMQIVELIRFTVKPGIQILGPNVIPIAPGKSVPYKMVAGFGEETGIYVYPLIFQFFGDAGAMYVYREMRFFSLASGLDSTLYAALAPITPYKPKKQCFVHLVEIPTVPAPPLKRLEGDGLPKVVKLPFSPVPSLLAKLVNHKLVLAEFENDLDVKGKGTCKKYLEVISGCAPNSTVLNKINYKDRFSILLFLEEMQINKEISDYNMSGAVLCAPTTYTSGYLGHQVLALKIPGLVENRPCVVQGDCLYITLDKHESERFQGRVAHVNMDSVELIFDKKFYRIHKIGDLVSVQFGVNRYTYDTAHRAIGNMNNFDILFPTKFKGIDDPDTPLEFSDQKIMSNPEQMQAVRNCVDGTSFPAPYIIFGPPGTGKTSTLIEIIKQLWLRASQRNYRIVVCTPSNAAADLITELLMELIPVNDIFRLYSASRSFSVIPDKIKESGSCNYDASGSIWYPDIVKLKAFKIVVMTLYTSARLVTAGFGLDNHFSHIIIDESGQASEPEALIPLSGFAGFKPRDDKRRAQVILAGDPNQLGPIIRSKLAADMGLDISLLERLMNLDFYKKDKNGKYNPALITKLVLNHRSHGAIIEASNKLFYDNELKVNGDKNVINMALNWTELPNKNYPVIFHGVKGQEERESSSPSWFNRAEIITIMNYLEKILKTKSFNGQTIKPDDIGVISPYHKQVMKLRQACADKRWHDVKIGSVEEFQGSEKLVTIVSTVRSKQEVMSQDLKNSLGFLSNPKRMNVALTRARALMIVVGDPDVLLCDHRWKTFIVQCRKQGAIAAKGYFNEEALEETNGVSDLANNLGGINIRP